MSHLTWFVVLAACGGSSTRETMPSEMMGPPPAPAVAAPPAGSADHGELILRSGGKDIGHERFTITRDGAWDKVALTAATTFPDPIAIELAMWVDPVSWKLDRYDLHIERGGTACDARLRNRGEMVELEVEYPDGERQTVDREDRAHAEYFVSIRPAITQSAVCAVADDQPRALESFSPWYIVRTAPRVPSAVAKVSGAGKLDLVKVDGLIDVYCDGPRLAIVHYAKHGFIAASAEYDAAAQTLTAGDPTDELWASELGCPARKPAP